MSETATAYYQSPLGSVKVSGNSEGITAVFFVEEEQPPTGALASVDACIRQIEEYFQGIRREFSVPLAPQGTPFQMRVWEALQTIPYGTTTTYAAIATLLGDINAVRAVGAANGRNAISIIIPCHRVIGADGSLTGYAGGLWRKQWLLEHEGALAQPGLFL